MDSDGRVTVKFGDELRIRCGSNNVDGVVLTVNWYGERDGWFIELGNAYCNGRKIGYSYWKQGADGGHITAVNGTSIT